MVHLRSRLLFRKGTVVLGLCVPGKEDAGFLLMVTWSLVQTRAKLESLGSLAFGG